MAINLTALNDSGYYLEEPERIIGAKKILRYKLQINADFDKARLAITKLRRDNPSLFLVSEGLALPVPSCPYLVINGSIICLSRKGKIPSGIHPICEDTFFSESVIEEPTKCSKNHWFEKKYIQIWVQNKGNVCPNDLDGSHPVGEIKVDSYHASRIVTLCASFQTEQTTIEKREANAQQSDETFNRQLATIRNVSYPKSEISNLFHPRQEPFVKFYLQLTHKAKPFQGVSLTLDEKLQVFKKIAQTVPLEKLSDVIGRMDDRMFDEVLVHAGFQRQQHILLLQKLRLMPKDQVSKSSFFTLPKFVESLETAFSYVQFDHNPSSLYEATQMLTIGGMAVMGLYLILSIGGWWAVLGAFGLGAGYSAYNHIKGGLPHEIPPAQNYTEFALKENFPLLGRDLEIEQIFQALASTGKGVRNHPLLVGPAGAGKTAIMQEVARLLALKASYANIPQSLKDGNVYFCPASELVPSNIMEGTLKFDDFFRRIRVHKDRLLLALDEVHTFVSEDYKKVFGQKIKSILDTSMNGIPYILSATTTEEYRKYIQNDESLARRFAVIKVDLLDKNHTVAALYQQVMIQFPELVFAPKHLYYIYDKSQFLADKYKHFKQPEISKKVLSRAMALIQSEIDSATPTMKELNKIKGEKERYKIQFGYNVETEIHEIEALGKIAEFDKEINKLEDKIHEEKEELKKYYVNKNKIIESMKMVIALAQKEMNPNELKLFKFLSRILIPDLFITKCRVEKKLQIKQLDENLIDSVIQEIDRNQI